MNDQYCCANLFLCLTWGASDACEHHLRAFVSNGNSTTNARYFELGVAKHNNTLSFSF